LRCDLRHCIRVIRILVKVLVVYLVAAVFHSPFEGLFVIEMSGDIDVRIPAFHAGYHEIQVSGFLHVTSLLVNDGGPCRTRTCDMRLRRPLLYPAELRNLLVGRTVPLFRSGVNPFVQKKLLTGRTARVILTPKIQGVLGYFLLPCYFINSTTPTTPTTPTTLWVNSY
jgi:hypothetical protein